MARLPKDLEEKRQRLMRAVRRGAFESYMRRGRVPYMYERIFEAVSEAKALSPEVSLDKLTPAKPVGRPTTHYVWRTAGDNRVRGAHAARNGQIFAWNDPPEHGHPGREQNCRCWPEPYYGDLAVPDALLEMVAERRVSTDPNLLWASIDTVTRPDGSLAASNVVLNDGAFIESTFAGSTAISLVKLPGGEAIEVENRNGSQTIYLGEQRIPLLQTRWTTSGPAITRAHRRLAFLMDEPLGPDLYFDPVQSELDPGWPIDPNPLENAFNLDSPDAVGAAAAALLLLYLMRQAEPATMGAGPQDAAYLAFRAWTNGRDPQGNVIPVPIALGSVTEEQARESCKLLPDVQAWTDQAALMLAMSPDRPTPQNYGIQVHNSVKREVDARKAQFPLLYRGVFAEFSILASGRPGGYGEIETRRFDVIEKIPPERPSVICNYEVKTGRAQLSGTQLKEYMARLAAADPGAIIFMFQINPTYRPPR